MAAGMLDTEEMEAAPPMAEMQARTGPPPEVSASDVEMAPPASQAGLPQVSADDVEMAPAPAAQPQAVPMLPHGSMQAHNPTLLEQGRAALANTAIGHSLQSTMPRVASALGLTPTEADASPTYQQHKTQIIAPEYMGPHDGAADAASPSQLRTEGALRGIGGLTSGENVAMMAGTGALAAGTAGIINPASAALVGRLVSGGFTIDMLRGLYQQSKQYRAAVDRGDKAEAHRIQGEMGVSGVMALLTGHHALHGAGAPSTFTEGAADGLREGAGDVMGRPAPAPVEPVDTTRTFTSAANASQAKPATRAAAPIPEVRAEDVEMAPATPAAVAQQAPPEVAPSPVAAPETQPVQKPAPAVPEPTPAAAPPDAPGLATGSYVRLPSGEVGQYKYFDKNLARGRVTTANGRYVPTVHGRDVTPISEAEYNAAKDGNPLDTTAASEGDLRQPATTPEGARAETASEAPQPDPPAASPAIAQTIVDPVEMLARAWGIPYSPAR